MTQKGDYLLESFFTIDKYVDMKIKGYSDEGIAFSISVNMSTLERWKTRNGVTRRAVNLRRAEIIKQKRNQGLSNKEVALILKVTPRTISNIIKQYGVEINEKNCNNRKTVSVSA